MITKSQFFELVREIELLGFDEETAARYASIIGDTPIIDEQGNVLVIEEGRPEVKLKLKFFGA